MTIIEKFVLARSVAHGRLMEHLGGCQDCHLISNGTTIFCQAVQGLYVTWMQMVAFLEGAQSQGVLS